MWKADELVTSLCMCVLVHGYGEFGGGWDGGVDGMRADKSRGGGRMSGNARAFPECEVMLPSRCAAPVSVKIDTVFLRRPWHGTPR